MFRRRALNFWLKYWDDTQLGGIDEKPRQNIFTA